MIMAPARAAGREMHPATAWDGWSVNNSPALVRVELAHNTTVGHVAGMTLSSRRHMRRRGVVLRRSG